MDRKRVLWDALTAYQAFCPDCDKERADAFISTVFAQETVTDDFIRIYGSYLAPVLDFNIDRQKALIEDYRRLMEAAGDAPGIRAMMEMQIDRACDATENYIELYRLAI